MAALGMPSTAAIRYGFRQLFLYKSVSVSPTSDCLDELKERNSYPVCGEENRFFPNLCVVT